MTRIALLRRVHGLFAFRVARDGDGFVEELTPLSYEREPHHRELLDAWQALGAVREIRPEVLEAVRCVLAYTVLDPEGERPTLARLEIAPPPTEHKATAANPRAYQGTKEQPPKPRRPEPRDLRPFLCVRGGQDRLVQLLTRELGPVDLPTLERGAPPGFLRGLGWFAHLSPERYAGALAVHHALELEHNLPLRHASSLFANVLMVEGRMAWLRFVAHIVPAMRIRFLDLITEVGVDSVDPGDVSAQLVQIAAMCTEDSFATRMRYALSVVKAGDQLDDAKRAFELADLHSPDFRFLQHSEDYYAPIRSDDWRYLQQFVSAYYRAPEWEVMHAWEACCKDPALATELAHIATAALDIKAAQFLGGVLASAVVYGDTSQHSWLPWRQELRRFVAEVRTAPVPYKAVDLLDDLAAAGTFAHLAAILPFVPIACMTSLNPKSSIGAALERFGIADAKTHAALLRAPQQSFAVLDQECERRDDAWVIQGGFDSFLHHAANWFVAAFAQHPRTLCRAAHTVGLFAKPQRDAIVKAVMHSALAVDPTHISATELVKLFEDHGPKSTTSPIPKKLRQHVDGEIQLSEAQLECAATVVRQAWPAVLADRMHESALGHMARNLGDEAVDLRDLNQQMVHALKLQTGADTNQRAIRRLLRACYRGDTNYLQQHPRNLAWLRQHASLGERWLKGFTLSRELKDCGTVTLSIETEPLEALRLGTYVGSCYGLGGGFMWSAAAVVLDSNKQVVFARDAQQRFLARQVLAITDDDKLACYSVYPSCTSEMRALFADFDKAFAKTLGVPIETHSADDKVAMLLASRWWDDCVWDPDESHRSDSGEKL